MNGSFLLTLIWAVPFLTALVSLPVDRDDHRRIKKISLAGNLINLLLVIGLTFAFISAEAEHPAAAGAKLSQFHFTGKTVWLQMLNIEYNIGVDAISVLMMLLTAIVIFCGVLASWGVEKQAKEFLSSSTCWWPGCTGCSSPSIFSPSSSSTKSRCCRCTCSSDSGARARKNTRP